ncbi:MAG: type II toxin-antitoxin system RelE/ParE family toxin, partial [Selenomonas sp.]|nr:type II toxin-antitoxin system RelE/ParE family toxin [Selenomonas sp.]
MSKRNGITSLEKSLITADSNTIKRNFERIALRKLDMLNAACNINALRVPPGNRLEQLHGDREGQYSIRINGQ